jgi:hypothetical protein
MLSRNTSTEKSWTARLFYTFISGWCLCALTACGVSPASTMGRGAFRDIRDRDLLLAVCGPSGCDDAPASPWAPSVAGRHPGQNGPLTPEQQAMAKAAWQYFENNYQEETGLVNAVNEYPSTTMWDTASYLAALVSAHQLGVIDKSLFDLRVIKAVSALNTLSLFHDQLPNKVYHTKTLEKVDYGNNPGEIGYSAIDIARLLIWLSIIKQDYPEHGNIIDRTVLRWNFKHILDGPGTMYGAGVSDEKKVEYFQEGRLGYEEYAAKAFQIWGFTTTRASKPEPYNIVSMYGIDIPYDSRDPRTLQAHNYVVCESYILDAIEFNWDLATDDTSDDMQHTDPVVADFAQRVYTVQAKRYAVEGILTARTEHQLDQAPYFIYDTIYSDGQRWNTLMGDTGKSYPEYSAVSLKAALGLWAVWDTEYTRLLYAATANLYDPKKGFYEGLYEDGTGLIKTFTANNNGIILEALLYKVKGKLHRKRSAASLWDTVTNDEFKNHGHCYPNDRNCDTRK